MTALSEFSMYISKASLHNGVMRWSAVNSDTEKDSYQERMSRELFEDFISHIQNEEGLPETFRSLACSDYWCGGMPYVSVSHYSDQNGNGVPGEVLELFVDGDKLKARGVLFDSPLGLAVWRSLREDKLKPVNEKIRISIGFLDLAHRHGGGEVWVRENMNSICPECLQGEEDKTYVKGYLVHLALTRVPVNKRTEMVLEEKSMTTKSKKTRKDDAQSIVGELADTLDEKEKAIKNMAMVELSENEQEEVKKTPETPETPVVEDKPEETIESAESVGEIEKPAEPKVEIDASDALEASGARVVVKEASPMDMAVVRLERVAEELKDLLVSKSETHPLQPAIDEFLAEVDNSAVFKSDQERAQIVNPAFQKLGTAITGYLNEKSSQPDEQTNEPAQKDKELLDEIRNLSQQISTKMEDFGSRLGLLEAQRAQGVEVRSRIPARKSLSPEAARQAVQSQSSLKSIVRKSVGLSD